jgi:hypothetical protein
MTALSGKPLAAPVVGTLPPVISLQPGMPICCAMLKRLAEPTLTWEDLAVVAVKHGDRGDAGRLGLPPVTQLTPFSCPPIQVPTKMRI